MSHQVNLHLVQQLQSVNEKLLQSAQSFTQKKKVETLQNCYQKNNNNANKFAKCVDDGFTKIQKALQQLQYKLIFSKIGFTECLQGQKIDVQKCKQNANNVVGEAKSDFSKQLK